MPHLGALLNAQLGRSSLWLKALYICLLVFVLLNLAIRPLEPHFGLDAYPGFWAAFGFSVGFAMVYVMKRVIQPLITRKEDYYGDI